MSKKKKPKEDQAEHAAEEKAESSADTAQEGNPAGAQPEPDPLELRLLRLQADFDNYRKRMVRERQEWAQRAAEDLVSDLLPVLDHYEMGLDTASKHQTDDAVQNGFQLVYDQLMSTLKKSGLEPIDAEGNPFDPHLHEAITHLPSADHDADLVMNQTRRGYRLGSKLLRPAQVVVSSGPPEETGNNSEADETEPSSKEG